MYSNEDFENIYVRYKAEGLPRGMSIQSLYLNNFQFSFFSFQF